MYLPAEIPDCIPHVPTDAIVSIENLDFTSPDNRRFILEREQDTCFYCRRELHPDTYELDHVVPSSNGGDESYRNIVATCIDCNNTKGAQDASDFLRSLYRHNLLSNEEFEDRLRALESLVHGRLVPPIPHKFYTDNS